MGVNRSGSLRPGLPFLLTLAIVYILTVELAPRFESKKEPIIRWVIIAVVILWLLSLFVGDIPLPRFR